MPLLACSNTVSGLNRQQKGRLAETIAKALFLANGFEVYEPEFDDRGIDMLVRHESRPGRTYEIQVKGITNNSYTFLRKKFIDDNAKEQRFVCYIRLDCNPEPEVFLIPLKAWNEETALLKIRDYKGRKSDPEYGICYSKRNANSFKAYEFNKALSKHFGIIRNLD